MNTQQCQFNRGDPVAFQFGSRWIYGKFVTYYPEFHSAVRVKDNKDQEYTVTPQEVVSEAERAKMIYEEKREEARSKYSEVITAFHAGFKTPKEISKHLGWDHRKTVSDCRNARRWGLIR